MITIWGIVIVASIVVEIMTVDLVSIWITIGAGIALALAALKISVPIQIAVCIISTLLAMIVIRPLAKKYLRTNTVKTNSDRLIGKLGKVTETIEENGKGRVLINGEDWMASSLSNSKIEKGQDVEIIYIEGAHVVVKEM